MYWFYFTHLNISFWEGSPLSFIVLPEGSGAQEGWRTPALDKMLHTFMALYSFFCPSKFILRHTPLTHHVLARLVLFLFLENCTVFPTSGAHISSHLEFPAPLPVPHFAWLAPSHSWVILACGPFVCSLSPKESSLDTLCLTRSHEVVIIVFLLWLGFCLCLHV